MRAIANLVCGFGVLACGWLAVMFVVLHRPGFERGVIMSVLFVFQSLLALATVNGILRATACRVVALAGAAGLVWSGGLAVTANLNARHFEAYALLIAIGLILQGLLTAQQLIPTWKSPSSKVHQFGN